MWPVWQDHWCIGVWRPGEQHLPDTIHTFVLTRSWLRLTIYSHQSSLVNWVIFTSVFGVQLESLSPKWVLGSRIQSYQQTFSPSHCRQSTFDIHAVTHFINGEAFFSAHLHLFSHYCRHTTGNGSSCRAAWLISSLTVPSLAAPHHHITSA